MGLAEFSDFFAPYSAGIVPPSSSNWRRKSLISGVRNGIFMRGFEVELGPPIEANINSHKPTPLPYYYAL
jgi:hypothetical protein